MILSSNSVKALSYNDSTLEKYDSLRFSFLPKYEIYARYFNPFEITKNDYSFDFGFKWHTKKLRYLTSHFIARKALGLSYEMLTFSQMYRLTYKIDWIHLELSYGIVGSHLFNSSVGYTENGFGIGAIFRSDLQFDIGPFANISLGLDISPNLCYNFRQPIYPWSGPLVNGFSTPIFFEDSPSFIHVAFNLYIK